MNIKTQLPYLKTTCLISVLLGIILPLALGVKDLTLIAITFTAVWFLYVMILFIYVFLINPGIRIRVIQRKNPTIVRYDILDSEKKKTGKSEKEQYPIESEKKSPVIYN